MHRRSTFIVLVLTLAFAVGVTGCGGGEQIANTGPSPGTSSTTTTTKPVTTLPPLTLPSTTNTTVPPSTTTTVVTVTTTTAPKPTSPPGVTTTLAAIVRTFCDYVKSIDPNPQTVWVTNFYERQAAVEGAQGKTPPELVQSVSDVKAVFDAAAPMVQVGTISTEDEMIAWIASQSPETLQRISTALQVIRDYIPVYCK